MTYKLNIVEVLPRIFMVSMNNQNVLGRTFMRFQEHYESPYPEIKNTIFTRDHFKKIYKERRGASKFTYCDDWAGYNFPSYVLKHFIDGKFNPLIGCEKQIVDYFRKLVKDSDKGFYIIGTISDDETIINHELSHGLWYTNKKYKTAQRKAISSLSKETRDEINNQIRKFGYCDEVLEDETVAYLTANGDWVKEHCRVKARVLNPVIAKLKTNFAKFSAASSQK